MRVTEAIQKHARERPDDAAAVCGVETAASVTWRRLLDDAGRLAREHGWAEGDTILLSLPNGVEYLTCLVAGLIAGATVTPSHPSLKEREIERIADAAGVGWIIRGGEVSHVNRAARDGVRRDGPAVNLQSSGTTGRSRLAVREAEALDRVAENTVEALGLSERDDVLTAMPLCHSYGVDTTLAALLAGACMVIQPVFNAGEAAAILSSSGGGRTGAGRARRVVFPGVPVMFEAMARERPREQIRNCLAYSAGTMLPSRVAEEMRANWGVRIGQLYGATELGSVTFNDPRGSEFVPSSVGVPMRGVSIRVLDPLRTNTEPLARGEEGEVAVRAPSMLSRYIDGKPESADGHFLTGDLGSIDDKGHLSITGRIKLLIDVGGIKVNPLEVELALREHPGVEDCVVVAEPLSDTITKLRAVMTSRPGAGVVRAEDLRAFARERLAPYKIPRVFDFVDALPRTATGKVLRASAAWESR